jgi:hypothetical protein
MSLDNATVARTDVVAGPRPSVPPGDAAWIEPWLFARDTRPRSQYWDVEAARWTARSSIPAPRRGD